jgi:hypothetical protein
MGSELKEGEVFRPAKPAKVAFQPTVVAVPVTNYGPCDYCGPFCYRGAAHNSRVEAATKEGSWRPTEIERIDVVRMDEVPEPPERINPSGEWRDKFAELHNLAPGEALRVPVDGRRRLWHVRRVMRLYAQKNNRVLSSSRSKDYKVLYLWLEPAE